MIAVKKEQIKAVSTAILICAALLLPLASCDVNNPWAGDGNVPNSQATHTPPNVPLDKIESSDGSDVSDVTPSQTETAYQIPDFPMPIASGQKVSSNERAEIDYSNAEHGYVMVRFLVDTDMELRTLVANPCGDRVYTYVIYVPHQFEVLPLTGGDGEYNISVFEQIEGDRYSSVLSHSIDVILEDEFAPFMRPNQFVNFNRETKVIAVAAGLVQGIDDFHERVAEIYHFVVTHLEYDFELAATVQPGYLPDLDVVYVNGRGICFDYSAMMTAMLRSIGVPTQLVIGYAGEAYHAWINVYSENDGWIDGLLFFDGHKWHYMDPTFTSAGGLDNEAIRQLIGGGTAYNGMWTY